MEEVFSRSYQNSQIIKEFPVLVGQVKSKSKAVPLHAMEALGGRGV
jgi:hypothetical protein